MQTMIYFIKPINIQRNHDKNIKKDKKETTLKIISEGTVEEKKTDFQELRWRLKITVIHRCKALQNWI